MPVELTDNIAPSGDSGGTPSTFSTHLDIYGNGGYRSVADESERLGNSGLLTELRRKLGMAVYQQDTNKLYILTNNPATATTTNTDWTEFTSGGASDLQSVLEGGSQFVQPNGYTGGILSVKYTGPTGDPSNPIINSTGILIDANSTGTNNGENLMIAASGNVDTAFVTLHAQNVNSLPIGPVPYSRLEVGQQDISIDTNSTAWQGASIGNVLSIKSVNPGIGTNGSKYVIGSQVFDMQDVFDNSTPNITAIDATKKLSLEAGDVDIVTYDSSGGTSEIVLQANNSVTGTVNKLDIDGTNNLTTLTTNNLDVEVRASNTTAGPEVGDVLIIDSLQNSTYGRLMYKPGVQIARVQVSSIQLQNLFTTPVNLITGITGRYLMILEAYVALNFTTIGYNAGVKLQIQNTTYNIPVLETNEFLQSTAGGCRVFYPMDPSSIGPNDRPVGSSAGWELTCTADLGNSGDGSLDIFISYMALP